MPQQELNLLQLAALRSAELRRRAPQIVRRQLADPDLRCVLTHQLPHRALGQRILAHSAVRQHAPEDRSFPYPCHIQPPINLLLHPQRHSHRPRLVSLRSSCTLRPEWTWFVIKGIRSISANVVVLIDRIIVLNDRKISPRPLCNAKCQIRTRLPFILEMFTKLSSSVLTSTLYRTPPETPSRQCNASGACGTVRARFLARWRQKTPTTPLTSATTMPTAKVAPPAA